MSKAKATSFSDYEVRVRAYRIWERSGCPEGRAEEHWREALAELEAERTASQVPPQPAVATAPTRRLAPDLSTTASDKREDEAA